MSRRRYISTDVSLDKRLNRLAEQHGDFAALLYTWMVPHAADDATMNGDLDEFMAAVLPMRRDKSEGDVRAALSAMSDAGLIEWYEDLITFPLEAFYRYQSYIKVENRRTAEITGKRRATPTNADERRATPIISSESSTPDSTPENTAQQRKTPENAASFPPSLSPSLPTAPASDAREQKPKTARAPKEPVTPLTSEERDKLLKDFPHPETSEQIALAVSHKAHLGYPTNQYGYVRNWLRRANLEPAGNGGLRIVGQPSEPPKKSINDLLAEQEESDRRWEERIKRDGVMPGGIPTDA